MRWDFDQQSFSISIRAQPLVVFTGMVGWATAVRYDTTASGPLAVVALGTTVVSGDHVSLAVHDAKFAASIPKVVRIRIRAGSGRHRYSKRTDWWSLNFQRLDDNFSI